MAVFLEETCLTWALVVARQKEEGGIWGKKRSNAKAWMWGRAEVEDRIGEAVWYQVVSAMNTS